MSLVDGTSANAAALLASQPYLLEQAGLLRQNARSTESLSHEQKVSVESKIERYMRGALPESAFVGSLKMMELKALQFEQNGIREDMTHYDCLQGVEVLSIMEYFSGDRETSLGREQENQWPSMKKIIASIRYQTIHLCPTLWQPV